MAAWSVIQRRHGLRRRTPIRKRKVGITRNMRKEVFHRDGETCQRCGGRGSHAHHIIPRGRGGEDTHDNLTLLCWRCHEWVHEHPKAATEEGWLKPGRLSKTVNTFPREG